MNPQFLVGMSGDFTTLVTPSWIPWKGRCFRWGHRHLHLQVGIGDGPWVSLARSTLWKMPNKNGKTVWVVRSDEGEPALIIASSMFTPKTWRNPRTHHISTPHGQATPPIRRIWSLCQVAGTATCVAGRNGGEFGWISCQRMVYVYLYLYYILLYYICILPCFYDSWKGGTVYFCIFRPHGHSTKIHYWSELELGPLERSPAVVSWDP